MIYTTDFSKNHNSVIDDVAVLEDTSFLAELTANDLLTGQIMTLTAPEFNRPANATMLAYNINNLTVQLSDVQSASGKTNKLAELNKYIYKNSVIGRLNMYKRTINENIGDKYAALSNIDDRIFSNGFTVKSKNEIHTLKYDSLNIESAPFLETSITTSVIDKLGHAVIQRSKSVSTIINTYEEAEAFVETCLDPLLNSDEYLDYNLREKITQDNNILPNIVSEIDTSISNYFYSQTGNIVKLSDIKEEIIMFIEELNNLYSLDMQYTPVVTEVSTTIGCNVTQALSGYNELSLYDARPKAITNITISPNVTTPISNNKTYYLLEKSKNDKTTIFDAAGKNVQYQYHINLDNLTKLNTNQHSDSEMFNNIFKTDINGQFLFNTNTIKKKLFGIKDINKLFDEYELVEGNVISKQKILSLLDVIFVQWIRSINLLHVDISFCHNNCHSNVFNIALKNSTFYGCMACGKLVLHSFYDDFEALDEEFGNYLSISLSTNLGNFVLNNGTKVKCITLTADLTRAGDYPDITKFTTTYTRSANQKDGDNITKIYKNAFDQSEHVALARSKTLNICAVDVGNYDDETRTRLTSTVDDMSDSSIVYKTSTQITESMYLKPDEKYGCLVGDCIVPEYKVDQINYTFYDFFNKKNKINASLPYGTRICDETGDYIEELKKLVYEIADDDDGEGRIVGVSKEKKPKKDADYTAAWRAENIMTPPVYVYSTKKYYVIVGYVIRFLDGANGNRVLSQNTYYNGEAIVKPSYNFAAYNGIIATTTKHLRYVANGNVTECNDCTQYTHVEYSKVDENPATPAKVGNQSLDIVMTPGGAAYHDYYTFTNVDGQTFYDTALPAGYEAY